MPPYLRHPRASPGQEENAVNKNDLAQKLSERTGLSRMDAQKAVDVAYVDRASWLRKSILNIARMGKFSSDRTIREYARDIWHIKPAVIGNFANVALLDLE